jgi:excisionase family DNA binding protein
MEPEKPRTQPRSAFSVDETAARLGLERKSVYEAVRTGAIPSIRIGRRILIPASYLGRLEDASR